MPSATVEDYIKQIFLEDLRREDDYVPMGQIAQSLSVVPGTATAMVKSLAEADLVDYQPRRGVSLTSEGRNLALKMLRRHRIIEVFLVNTLGLSWGEVHDEAERLEHALSDRVLEKLDAFLGHPQTDPHGSPIPRTDGSYTNPPLHNLTECLVGIPLRLARVTSQQADFLDFLEARALMPGARVVIRECSEVAGTLTIEVESGETVALSLAAAKHIFAEEDSSPRAPSRSRSRKATAS